MKRILSIAALTSFCAAALLPLSSNAQAVRVRIDSPAPVHVQHQYYDDEHDYAPPRRERLRRDYADDPRGDDRRPHMRKSRWDLGWHEGGRNGMPYWRERQDLDRDGIRDGEDNDIDNDGVHNRNDRDVDGDGVSNRRDRHPDNPYAR